MSESEVRTQHSDTESAHDVQKATLARKKGFIGLFTVIVLAAVGYSTYWYFWGSRYVTTDNAYASTEVAVVTPAVNGIVKNIQVVDTQYVHRGDVLVTLDNTDATLAVEKAEADLALAKRRVRSYLASDEGYKALVDARAEEEKRARAELASAQAKLEQAQIQLSRRKALVRRGSLSAEELTNAQTAYTRAQADLRAAEAAVSTAAANRLSAIGNQKANAALIDHTTVENNPEVLLAAASLKQAQVNLSRTVIRAPVDGVVAKRQVQVGQHVQIGASLMSVVPVNRIYVDANFKEVQLNHVKVGQKVELTSDLYGHNVIYHGVVTGIAGGTGAAFSVIPAQNATGNWIKVVQRLPVRIAIAPEDLAEHPLQVGLSMEVTIDTDSSVSSEELAQYHQAAVAITQG